MLQNSNFTEKQNGQLYTLLTLFTKPTDATQNKYLAKIEDLRCRPFSQRGPIKSKLAKTDIVPEDKRVSQQLIAICLILLKHPLASYSQPYSLPLLIFSIQNTIAYQAPTVENGHPNNKSMQTEFGKTHSWSQHWESAEKRQLRLQIQETVFLEAAWFCGRQSTHSWFCSEWLNQKPVYSCQEKEILKLSLHPASACLEARMFFSRDFSASDTNC